MDKVFIAAVIASLVTLALSIVFTNVSKIDFTNTVFFLVLFTVCANFDIELRDGARLSLGLAPLIGALVALPIKDPAVEVVWIFLIGSLVTLVTERNKEISKERILELLFDYSAVGAFVLIYRLLLNVLPEKPELQGHYWPGILIASAIAAAFLFIAHVLRLSYMLSKEGQYPAGAYFSSVLRKYWVPFIAIGFLGVLMGLVFIGIGNWFVILVLPLLAVIRYAYNRIAAADIYLLGTVKTLSVIPEEIGKIPPGHSKRLATLAGAVARELGLGPEDTRQVEYAAYLHDIGVIAREEEHVSEQDRLLGVEEVVSGGEDILGKVDYLKVASEILRGRGGLEKRVVDPRKRRAVSVGSGILKAAEDFENLITGSDDKEPLSESEALTEMNLERGVKYDSKVLRAIAKVLPRISGEDLSFDAEVSSESAAFWREPED